MKIAHVTDARWLLAVLSVALLLAACDSNGDEADAESAVDLSGTVMVAGQSQEPQELPGDEALEFAEERMGFPVVMPEEWPWEEVVLTSVQLLESPLARPDHTGNEADAFYDVSSADARANVGITQRYYPGSQGSEPPEAQMAAGAPMTFAVDEHTVHALPVSPSQFDFVLHAGEWTFVVSASGNTLPTIEGFEPLLRSLIEEAQAASEDGG